jgi:hypothetical protein
MVRLLTASYLGGFVDRTAGSYGGGRAQQADGGK